MSKEALEGFLQKMREDKKLQQRLQAEAEGKPNPIPYVVEAAGRLGFEFTGQEFIQAQEAIQGKLTDEQLAAVAGGKAPTGEHIVSWTFHW